MFTGIIQAIGSVAKLQNMGGDVRLSIHCPDLNLSQVSLGDSIASNGVCLTAVEIGHQQFSADVSRESLAHTTIGKWQRGSLVNLELALTPQSFLGGHMVSGHVDGTGHISARQQDGRSVRFEIRCAPELHRYIAAKGSICVDGVSLTVNSIQQNSFSLNIVPHTLEKTALRQWRVGTLVNLEVDVIARYLERLLAGESGVSREQLLNSGFMV